MPAPRPMLIGVLLALAPGAAALAATGPAAPAGTAAVPGPPTADLAWTARILYPVDARSAPRPDARVVDRVMHYTAFSRGPQILMITGHEVGPGGGAWVRVELPERPNGRQAWVPEQAAQLATTTTRLRVRTRSHRVEVWRDGRMAESFRAAVGTGSTPTPTGLFAIQDPVQSRGEQRSYLGPYILTLTAHSAVLRSFMGGDGLVAIHGTNAPGLLGQAVSHGCIRVSNEAVVALHRLALPGTPVQIVST